jgi:hypothetical protein
LLLVATIVPLIELILNLTLKLSLPSVVASALVVIVKEPLLLEMETDPLRAVVKSLELIVPETPSIVQ